MKNTSFARLALKVAVFYFTVAGVCQTVQAQSEIRFRLVRDTLIVASMTADNQGPFDFILDTGADTTIVDSTLAAKLSLVPLGQVQQTTVAGVQTIGLSTLPSLAAGSAHVENLRVLVRDLAEVRKMDSHIVGIAGQDFLSHFNYLIDYWKHTVRIEAGSEIQDTIGGEPVTMEPSGNRMIIPSEAQGAGHASLRLLVDSGANSLLLVGAAPQALNLPLQGHGVENTSTGQATLQLARVHELTVGSAELHDIPVAVSANGPKQIGDGLLPTVLFQAIYVNNQQHFLVFNPHGKRK